MNPFLRLGFSRPDCARSDINPRLSKIEPLLLALKVFSLASMGFKETFKPIKGKEGPKTPPGQRPDVSNHQQMSDRQKFDRQIVCCPTQLFSKQTTQSLKIFLKIWCRFTKFNVKRDIVELGILSAGFGWTNQSKNMVTKGRIFDTKKCAVICL